MNKKIYSYYSLIFVSLFTFSLRAQVVSVTPRFPIVTDEITLTFDVSQSNDGRAQGLLGLEEGVFLWSGAGENAGSGPTGAFEFAPEGQTDFNSPFTPGTMTSVGEDLWEITLTINEYYNIPEEDQSRIGFLGVLLKNGDGSAQTEDLFLPVFQADEYGVILTSPVPGASLTVDEGEQINIAVLTSESSDVEIFVDDVLEETFEGVTEVDFNLMAALGDELIRRVRVVATNGEDEVIETFTYAIIPESPIAELPSGLQNGQNFDPEDDTRVTLVLTAPENEAVFVVGSFTEWELSEEFIMNRTSDGNQYWLEVTGLEPGVEYLYQYWVNGAVQISDPYADKVLNSTRDGEIPELNYPNLIEHPFPNDDGFRVLTVLETGREPFQWAETEDTYVRPDKEDLIIYELYMGDFLGNHYFGQEGMIDTLSYFKRLGINAIELMPITDHEFDPGWGYDPFAMFAPEKYYGTRENLKEFIQAAHAMGIAVVQDIVFNHQTGLNPYNILSRDPLTGQIEEGNPYFNPVARHPFNVFEDMNHDSPFVREYLDSIAQYWIAEYHFDGYRFDLSKGFTQNNDATDFGDQGQWDDFDQSRIDNITRIANKIWDVDPTAYVILEHFAAGDEERVLGELGMLLWGGLHSPFVNNLNGTNFNVSLDRLTDSIYVGYMETHDEQRIIYEMLQEGESSAVYNIRDLNTALDRSKMAAAFFFPISGPKMLWQWQEYGYDLFLPFDNPGRTDPKPRIWGQDGLGYFGDPDRAKLFDTYAAIIKLTQEFDEVFDDGNVTLDLAGNLKSIRIDHETMNVNIMGNFDVTGQFFESNFVSTGTWYDFLTGDSINVTSVSETMILAPGEFHIFTNQRLEAPGVDLVPFEVEFDDNTVTSNEDLIEAGISVYPNPVIDFLTIRSEAINYNNAKIISLTGAELLNIEIPSGQSEFNIPTSSLNTGIYIVELYGVEQPPVRFRVVK